MLSTRDHHEHAPASWVGACSDVGLRHHINQDALALAVSSDPAVAIAVVSDGVTSAAMSEVGSSLAASTARDVVQAAISQALPHTETILNDAVNQAHAAVLSGAPDAAATIIVAVATAKKVMVGNVGDSRAYWVPDDLGEARLLSVDDSIAQVRIELGIPREQAESGGDSHAITRWVGRLADDVTPTIQSMPLDASGWLIVCTDGLWNYASDPADFAALVGRLSTERRTPVSLAEKLVSWAKEQGGRDNITVATLRLPPPS